jgi:hypothetical protein
LTELDELVLIESRARKHVAKAIQTNGKEGARVLEVYAAKADGNLRKVLLESLNICLGNGLINTKTEKGEQASRIARRKSFGLVRRIARFEKERSLHSSSRPNFRTPSIRGYGVWEYAARSVVFQAFFRIPSLRAVVMSCTPDEIKRLDADFINTVNAYH